MKMRAAFACLIAIILTGCASHIDLVASTAAKYSESAGNLAKAGESQLQLYRHGRRAAILENQFLVNVNSLPGPGLVPDQFLLLICRAQADTIVRQQQLTLLKEYGETMAKLAGAPERNMPALVGSLKAKVPEPPNAVAAGPANDAQLPKSLTPTQFYGLCEQDLVGLLDPELLTQMNAAPEEAGGDFTNLLGYVGAVYDVILDGLQIVERSKRLGRVKEYMARANDPKLERLAISKMIAELRAADPRAKELCMLNAIAGKSWPCRGRGDKALYTAWDRAILYGRRAAVSRAYHQYIGLMAMAREAVASAGTATSYVATDSYRAEVSRQIDGLLASAQTIDSQIDPPDFAKAVIALEQANGKLVQYMEGKLTREQTFDALTAAAKSTKGVLDHIEAMRKAGAQL